MKTRADSLLWWKKLGDQQKRDYASKWQNKLKEGELGKQWPFVSITNSSSTIERIYLFFNPQN